MRRVLVLFEWIGQQPISYFGQSPVLGNGGPADSVVSTPTKVAGITTAKSISFGTGHRGVLLKDATARRSTSSQIALLS